MMKIEFLLGGKERINFGNGHPIYDTPFVKSVVECLDDEKTEGNKIDIALPAFDSNTFIQFANHLVNDALKDCKMSFGKYRDKSFADVYKNHKHYYVWASKLERPCDQMQRFLDWVEFYSSGKKMVFSNGSSPFSDVIRIARYFQVSMCSGCGVMEEQDNARTKLTPCCRTKWPPVPSQLDYDKITESVDGSYAVKFQAWEEAWREAWKEARRQRDEEGKSCCRQSDNPEELCENCIVRKVGCSSCKDWECRSCQEDKETPRTFEKLHESDPIDQEGLVGKAPFQAMEASKCLRCRKRICSYCGYECYECHRIACESCYHSQRQNSWCQICKDRIEDDWEVNVDREEYICRTCFDSEPHYCGCGNRSYDPERGYDTSSSCSKSDEEAGGHSDGWVW